MWRPLPCSSSAPRPCVVGICGCTSSGKSTLTAALKDALAAEHGADRVGVVAQDDYFRVEAYGNDDCPMMRRSGAEDDDQARNWRDWRDWEHPESIDDDAFVESLMRAKEALTAAAGCRGVSTPSFLIVEGMHLLSSAGCVGALDALVLVETAAEDVWTRRNDRAFRMATQLPPEENYERLCVYLPSGVDEREARESTEERVRGVQTRSGPEKSARTRGRGGEIREGFEWLRCYFEDVVVPSMVAQKEIAAAFERGGPGVPVFKVSNGAPASAHIWACRTASVVCDSLRGLLALSLSNDPPRPPRFS
jgi:uridine kinase